MKPKRQIVFAAASNPCNLDDSFRILGVVDDSHYGHHGVWTTRMLLHVLETMRDEENGDSSHGSGSSKPDAVGVHPSLPFFAMLGVPVAQEPSPPWSWCGCHSPLTIWSSSLVRGQRKKGGSNIKGGHTLVGWWDNKTPS